MSLFSGELCGCHCFLVICISDGRTAMWLLISGMCGCCHVICGYVFAEF